MGITSAQGVATTLARAMAARIPLLRSFIVRALHNESISELSMEEKLESLVFRPLWKLKEEREKRLSVVRKEIREKSNIGIPEFESLHDAIRVRLDVETLKKDYLDALNAVKRDGMNKDYLMALEVVYVAYLRGLEDALSTPLVIVVDALDECEDARKKLFQQFLHFLDSFPVGSEPFKLFLSSRPVQDIMSIINAPRHAALVQLAQSSLHLLGTPSNRDIAIYAESRLAHILAPVDISKFVNRANGLVDWAATAADFIVRSSNPQATLDSLLEPTALTHRGQPLDSLYATILHEATAQLKELEKPLFLNLLQLIYIAREPLTLNAMDELLNLNSNSGDAKSERFVDLLASVLSGGRNGQPVQVLHPTFIEFLPRWNSRCDLVITIDDAELSQRCFTILLSSKLKYDILDVTRGSEATPMNKSIDDIEQRIQDKVTSGLRYAAAHALSHMAACLHENMVVSQLQKFFESKLLFWIELMSYLGKIYPLMQSVHFLAKRIVEVTVTGDNGSVSQ